jgi:NADPH2:quinone reductase
MQAIRFHQLGPPEVLRYEEIPKPEPSRGEALVRLEAIGINYTDIYSRTGLYPSALPSTAGQEGAGVVMSVGPDVRQVSVGDRVAFTGVPGAYAEYAVAPAWRLVRIPSAIDVQVAASVLLQGMTAHYLSHDTYPLTPGKRALVHAGAGGVGALLIQMSKQLGAFVIATTSSEAKAAAAREAGADLAVNYMEEDFEERVRVTTDGKGVDVVYDSVGKTTFEKSLRCLARLGCLVSYGQSSGYPEPFTTRALAGGSLYLTRPLLAHYTATPEDYHRRAEDVFRMVESGWLKVRIHGTFPLEEASEAHRLLESRATIGKLLLIP